MICSLVPVRLWSLCGTTQLLTTIEKYLFSSWQARCGYTLALREREKKREDTIIHDLSASSFNSFVFSPFYL